MTDIKQLTDERSKTHGDFNDVSNTAQALKSIVRQGKAYGKFTPTQAEGLDMILHKIARWVNGDPNFLEHLIDIEGYAHGDPWPNALKFGLL
jgi:hypothetical protein